MTIRTRNPTAQKTNVTSGTTALIQVTFLKHLYLLVFIEKNCRTRDSMHKQEAISELPFPSVSKQVLVQSLSR